MIDYDKNYNMADKFLYELGLSYRMLLIELNENEKSYLKMIPNEIIENIIDILEKKTIYRSKSQMIDFFNMNRKNLFIFNININNSYILKLNKVDGDKFTFSCTNINAMMDFKNDLIQLEVLIRVCRKFIKIYVNRKLLTRMNSFFTIKSLKKFEPESISGRMIRYLIFKK